MGKRIEKFNVVVDYDLINFERRIEKLLSQDYVLRGHTFTTKNSSVDGDVRYHQVMVKYKKQK